MAKAYRLGNDFPHEGFIQNAIEQHFSTRGFTIELHATADLACNHANTGERWLIEAKGVTSQPGLDFRTGLGQLLQGMSDATIRYGMAVPEDERFLAQCKRVSHWVRDQLGLHWLVVKSDGSVRCISPRESL